MPFITQERREAINNDKLKEYEVGDLCYLRYKDMVGIWKENPRWTTAHRIYEIMRHACKFLRPREQAAYELAWQVFFQIYVMPYEIKKRDENGDI